MRNEIIIFTIISIALALAINHKQYITKELYYNINLKAKAFSDIVSGVLNLTNRVNATSL